MPMDALRQITETERENRARTQAAQEAARRLTAEAEETGRALLEKTRAAAEAQEKALLHQAEARAAEQSRAIAKAAEEEGRRLRAAAQTHMDAAAAWIAERVGEA